MEQEQDDMRGRGKLVALRARQCALCWMWGVCIMLALSAFSIILENQSGTHHIHSMSYHSLASSIREVFYWRKLNSKNMYCALGENRRLLDPPQRWCSVGPDMEGGASTCQTQCVSVLVCAYEWFGGGGGFVWDKKLLGFPHLFSHSIGVHPPLPGRQSPSLLLWCHMSLPVTCRGTKKQQQNVCLSSNGLLHSPINLLKLCEIDQFQKCFAFRNHCWFLASRSQRQSFKLHDILVRPFCFPLCPETKFLLK